MLLLALETSGPTASVALMQEGSLLGEQSIHHTRTHSETVLPMAEQLMRTLDIAPDALGALAVNCGPGSFTGVRIGICTANAMGLALHIPVIGIDSLRVLYENVACYPETVCVLLDARNENVYAARYENGREVVPPTAGTLEECLTGIPAHTVFIGDGMLAYKERISRLVNKPVFVPPIYSVCQARMLCWLAHTRLSKMPQNAQAEPLYLRPSQAERMWERNHPQSRNT